MAEENTPEHQDRGLFGLFGKKKEEEAHQQHGTAVDPHGHGHVGEAHPVPLSYGHVEGGKLQGEREEKKHEGGHTGKLHRSNSSSSSSSSEEEDEKGEKKKKKKGGLKDKKKPGHQGKKEEEHGYGEHGEKKGLIDKIKEKIPGQHKEEEKGY